MSWRPPNLPTFGPNLYFVTENYGQRKPWFSVKCDCGEIWRGSSNNTRKIMIRSSIEVLGLILSWCQYNSILSYCWQARNSPGTSGVERKMFDKEIQIAWCPSQMYAHGPVVLHIQYTPHCHPTPVDMALRAKHGCVPLALLKRKTRCELY